MRSMIFAEEGGLLQLTDEQRMLRATVRDFAQREIAPVAAELDETGAYSRRDRRAYGRPGPDGHRGA